MYQERIYRCVHVYIDDIHTYYINHVLHIYHMHVICYAHISIYWYTQYVTSLGILSTSKAIILVYR